MTDGHCVVCGESYTKRGMTRHLGTCLDALPDADGTSLVHLHVTATGRSDYWLHLAVRETTTLDALDEFLRDLWLECCEHMSAFTVGDSQYTRPCSPDGSMPMLGAERRSMDASLATVLDGDAADKRQEFPYEYDFGTTTELSVRVVDTGRWDLATVDLAASEAPTGDGVYLLARNEAPDIDCAECGSAAATVCQPCLFDGGSAAWLCEDCARDHETDCDRPTLLPRRNSPRTGVCGYTG